MEELEFHYFKRNYIFTRLKGVGAAMRCQSHGVSEVLAIKPQLSYPSALGVVGIPQNGCGLCLCLTLKLTLGCFDIPLPVTATSTCQSQYFEAEILFISIVIFLF